MTFRSQQFDGFMLAARIKAAALIKK